jgi:hypothetical protein
MQHNPMRGGSAMVVGIKARSASAVLPAHRQRLVKGPARKAATLGYRLEPTAATAT